MQERFTLIKALQNQALQQVIQLQIVEKYGVLVKQYLTEQNLMNFHFNQYTPQTVVV